MKISKWISGAVIITLIGSGIYFMTGNNKAATQVEKTVTVEQRDLTETLSVTGEVQLYDDSKVFVKNNGQIVRRMVQLGDDVKAGQPLLKLDDRALKENLAQAKYTLSVDEDSLKDALTKGDVANETALVQAKANYDRAASDLQNAKVLMQAGSITESELKNYEAKVDSAKTDLKNSEDRVKTNRSADEIAKLNEKIAYDKLTIKNIETDLRNTTIKAATAGNLITFVDDTQSFINSGTLVATIADLKKLEVEAMISEYEVDQVKVGQSVQISTPGNPDKIYDGIVSKIYDVGEQKSEEVQIKTIIQIINPDQNIKQHFTVNLDILLASKKNALCIPYEAMTKTKEGLYTVTKSTGEKRETITLKTGLQTDLFVEVLNPELQVKDLLIVPTNKAANYQKSTDSIPKPDQNAL